MTDRRSPADAPTSDRLRKDIDEGRTGDKIGFPDPAAAPLGTDDEAAGSAPTPEQLQHAADMEAGRIPEARDSSVDRRPISGGEGTPPRHVQTTLKVAAAVVAVLVAGWLLWRAISGT
ncbi:hypothetical protein [Roseivivax isoporae]|uniref:Uncharacterized protein n=1 Tax=Roseivivax isoporae LMG 25204 TaxID=1449351 RepID=X7FAB7_9RHOB|nr:hypothetical protein [Roseivivax isoporae]ETX29021.1 hypothetical protein RISW2_03510 [Roseivivax isoporae LMG 25204]